LANCILESWHNTLFDLNVIQHHKVKHDAEVAHLLAIYGSYSSSYGPVLI